MIQLKHYKKSTFPRGTVFRVNGQYPYEDKVDMMLVETLDSDRPVGVMTVTGYHAGQTLVRLPYEACHDGTRMISAAWIKENWEKWIYPSCLASDVYVVGVYPPPTA